MMLRTRRHWGTLALLVGVAVIALGCIFLAFDSYLDPFDDHLFDSSTWLSADEQHRGPMARDAIRWVPVGTPMDRVRELLGEPTENVTGNPPDKWGRSTKGYTRWSYWLGCWSGLGWYGFDSANLDIHFNQQGFVVKAEVIGG